MTIVMRSWFRALAAIFKSPAPAQTVAGLATLVLVLYTGYTIPQPSMIGALRWITYINVRPIFLIPIWDPRINESMIFDDCSRCDTASKRWW